MNAWDRLKKIEHELIGLHESDFDVAERKMFRMVLQLYIICRDQQTAIDNLRNELQAKDIIL